MKKKLIALFALFAVALLLPLSALAQTTTPTPAAVATPSESQRLEYQYQRQKLALQSAANRLAEMDSLVALNASQISSLKATGTDATRLEKRQAQLQANLATAKLNYNQAKSVLDQHAGFDASGKVTDATQAKATLMQVSSLLQAARGGLGGGRDGGLGDPYGGGRGGRGNK